MFIKDTTTFYNRNRNFNYVLLAFFAICGSIVGVLVSYYADPFFLSLMRMAASRPVSIVDLPLMILFPFLVAAAISFVGKPFLLFPLSFFKSLAFALIHSSVCMTFGSAGWLISCLMLLSDNVCVILLFWYSLRHINGFRRTAVLDLLFACLISLSAGMTDSLLVSPYLAAIIKS